MALATRVANTFRYEHLPYLYSLHFNASLYGGTVVRPLFFEFPEDAGSWLIDDQYMFGSDLLVAPMITAGETRKAYLPPGVWIDYQSEKEYEGGRYHAIAPGKIPVVLLVRGGASIPHVPVAQSTAEMDLEKAERRVYGEE